MSNLNLPTMTFDALEAESKQFDRIKQRTIAYATTAEYVPQDGSTDAYVIIRHHGSVIAEIARGWVYVTNAGYSSQTTRTRIHQILTDNRQDYGFLTLGQNKGDQVLYARLVSGSEDFYGEQFPTYVNRELTRDFLSAHWDFENRTVAINAVYETVTL